MTKYERVFEVFKELFPGDIELLVIYDLYVNRGNDKSIEEFDYSQIKQTIINVSKLPIVNTGQRIQVERIFKSLIGIFIERTPGNFARFVLTPHSERLIELIVHRIDNPYLKFPLKETFETYFQLPDEASQDILALQRWYKLGFQNTARQVVVGHLEALKLAVDTSITSLNTVLETDTLTAIQMLQAFTSQFQILGTKAKQISEAIRMKDDVYYSIRRIVENNIERVFEPISYRDNVQIEGHQKLKDDLKVINLIKEEVYAFFDKVDKQLDIINARLTFASYKITELQETLKAQSYYKFSLKKLLAYLLDESVADHEAIKLPARFPKKTIVQEKFRFRTLRYWDMGFLRKANAFVHNIDENYESVGRAQLEAELAEQAMIHQLCDETSKELEAKKSLDLSTKLLQIVNDYSVEIGVHTGYQLVRNFESDVDISIDDKIITSDKNDTLHLWKIVLEKKQSSTS